MEIYFDRRNLKVLKAIYRSGDVGIRWDKLQNLFGNDADTYALENLDRAGYTVTKGHNGEYIRFDAGWDHTVYDDFRAYASPKGREMLERRCFDFWKWIIPTMISTAALVVSTLAAILG